MLSNKIHLEMSVVDIFMNDVSRGRVVISFRNGVIVYQKACSDGGPMRKCVPKDVAISGNPDFQQMRRIIVNPCRNVKLWE